MSVGERLAKSSRYEDGKRQVSVHYFRHQVQVEQDTSKHQDMKIMSEFVLAK